MKMTMKMIGMLIVLAIAVEHSFGQSPSCSTFNATNDAKFVEIALVCDLACYKNLGGNIDRAVNMMLSTVEASSKVWKRYFNLELVVTGVEVQTQFSLFDRKRQDIGDPMFLRKFNDYTRELMQNRNWQFDVAFLFTGDATGDVNGHATIAGVCRTIKNIPMHVAGGLVNVKKDTTSLRLVDTFTHEFGHTLGMLHEDNTLMSAISRPGNVYLNDVSIKQFTSFYCNSNKLSPKREFQSCFDKPTPPAERAYCGNGVIDDGEQCDCGISDKCSNYPCCEFRTCKASANGTLCSGISKWDKSCLGWFPPEIPMCDGISEKCLPPLRRSTRADGALCAQDDTTIKGEARCFQGKCLNRDFQCRNYLQPSTTPWLVNKTTDGSSLVSDDDCFANNYQGSENFFCSLAWDGTQPRYFGCSPVAPTTLQNPNPNMFCGALHCRGFSIVLSGEISIQKSCLSIKSTTWMKGNKVLSTVAVLEGTPCDAGKICRNGRCSLP